MMESLMFLLSLPFIGLGLTFLQRRKGMLGPVTGIKVYNLGRLMPTDMAMFAVDSGQVIAVGDAVMMVTDDVRRASTQADGGALATNQESFHDVFAGFALEASLSGSTTPIAVATAGLVEMDCASASHEVGDLIGMSENVAGDALLNTTGIKVAAGSPQLAIGRCAERSTTSTLVMVNFQSTIMFGGPQAAM